MLNIIQIYLASRGLSAIAELLVCFVPHWLVLIAFRKVILDVNVWVYQNVKSPESVRLLALLSLGEIGRHVYVSRKILCYALK